MATPRVFISMGTPYTEQYGLFRDKLEALLRDHCGVDPRIIGKNEYPPGNPLNHIRDVMRNCHGIVVVAYERTFIEAGIEKRTGKAERRIDKKTYTTPWNHIESAMAFGLGLPLYIICQHGLAEEGLIESKVDWYVQHIDLSPEGISRPEVVGSLRAWANSKVLPYAKKPRWLRALQGRLKLSDMTPMEIIVFGGLLVGTFSAGAAAANFFPKLFR